MASKDTGFVRTASKGVSGSRALTGGVRATAARRRFERCHLILAAVDARLRCRRLLADLNRLAPTAVGEGGLRQGVIAVVSDPGVVSVLPQQLGDGVRQIAVIIDD